ncbi:MAG: ABC-F family ATP-binding cassette domain-containing protein [Clostridiales bacterium]|nr:ABC-F family ATP-binding cassette domain-containing protein [Clostridiales bacterium]
MQLHKSFGENQVLKPLSFELRKGERVGIIGRNGSGKTTLLHLLSGRLTPDGGRLTVAPHQRMEVLDQIPSYPAGRTVEQVLRSAFAPLQALERELQALQRQMQQDHSRAVLQRYDKLQATYELEGGYEQDLRYNRVAIGLGLEPAFTQRRFAELSGGEQTKVNLARIVMAQPDLLLLDEPTNHLDMRSIEWLEEFLYGYPGTLVLISHDRTFLDRTVSRIFELEFGELRDFSGNYSEYMAYRERLSEELEHRHEQERREIERLQTISTKLLGWGIQTERLSRAALSMRKRIERLRENQTQTLRKNNRRIRASLDDGGRSGLDLLSVQEVSAGYDPAQPLFEQLSFELKRGERVALLGDNGSGKTTLIKLLTGELQPLSGRIRFGVNVRVGLMPQQMIYPHPERNLVDTLLYHKNITAQAARNRLASYDFIGEEVFKRVADLSGGERARLKHCLLSLDPINFFILDEPTNHLDIATAEWVEGVLEEYEGTMLFVSHDRYFISRFADRILTLEQGRLEDFHGNFEAYQAARAARPPQPAAAPAKPARAQAPARTLSPLRAERTLRRQLQQAERTLGEREAELQAVERELAEAATDYERLPPLVERQAGLQQEVDRLFEEWSLLAEQVAELDRPEAGTD